MNTKNKTRKTNYVSIADSSRVYALKECGMSISKICESSPNTQKQPYTVMPRHHHQEKRIEGKTTKGNQGN